LIHHDGHIKMMAATQPFISGAISKTINMPHEATPDDIQGAYELSWRLGLKAMALYRDGSKASQPLSSTTDEADNEEQDQDINAALQQEKALAWGQIPAGLSPTEAYEQGMQPPRFLLPARRMGFTQEARIGGHKVFLRTGEYEDGTLGELFIDLAKEGATLRGILSCFAIAVSKGLQYGVPLEEFVDTFVFQTFEPRGMVEGHPNIKMANSIVDYIFRALGVEYLHRDELAQVPPIRPSELPEPPKGLAVEAGVQLDLTEAAMEGQIDAQVEAARFVDSPTSWPNGSNGNGAVAHSSSNPESNARRVAGATATATATKTMMQTPIDVSNAPACPNCGNITMRSGSCHVCLTCGETTGCS
jgi:ribonucleoside-diphosphate reductase alpha chain